MFIVEVELVFSHDEAAEEDQGRLQEEHQVRLEEGGGIDIEAIFVSW